MSCYLILALIYIYLMTDDVEQLLLFIVAIYKSSLKTSVFKFLVHFSVVRLFIIEL